MTDVKESSDDKPFRGPPEESLSGAPSEGTRVNDFLDYVDYTAEWPAKPHVHPVEVEVQRKVAQIRDDMKEMHIRLNEVVQMVASERIPSPRPDLIRQIRLLRISMILETVMECLAVKNFYLAMKEAKRALKLAQELDDKLTISRCYYWMGRTEFMRGNIPAAHAYFKHALPCVEDDECVEGDFAGFWFKASRSAT
ncbi:hypothetical protein PENDEC_c004G07127 [Penicillium decumbens]|uniref:Uncharacterized protein n=1 Tax=Penicillium decumbens TaxID=69771 RepID=A0A1V6PI63_PENDC|nr:hypothetical protein PENDEC_c004G07127 [Penicillium decumbens]